MQFFSDIFDYIDTNDTIDTIVSNDSNDIDTNQTVDTILSNDTYHNFLSFVTSKLRKLVFPHINLPKAAEKM